MRQCLPPLLLLQARATLRTVFRLRLFWMCLVFRLRLIRMRLVLRLSLPQPSLQSSLLPLLQPLVALILRLPSLLIRQLLRSRATVQTLRAQRLLPLLPMPPLLLSLLPLLLPMLLPLLLPLLQERVHPLLLLQAEPAVARALLSCRQRRRLRRLQRPARRPMFGGQRT